MEPSAPIEPERSVLPEPIVAADLNSPRERASRRRHVLVRLRSKHPLARSTREEENDLGIPGHTIPGSRHRPSGTLYNRPAAQVGPGHFGPLNNRGAKG